MQTETRVSNEPPAAADTANATTTSAAASEPASVVQNIWAWLIWLEWLAISWCPRCAFVRGVIAASLGWNYETVIAYCAAAWAVCARLW
jgi:hypothetical protein